MESAMIDAAEPHRLFQHRLEHRRKVAGRGIDSLQDFGGGGLLLKRLVTLRSEVVSLGVALSKLTLEFRDELLRI
jgi:hypothetical protein